MRIWPGFCWFCAVAGVSVVLCVRVCGNDGWSYGTCVCSSSLFVQLWARLAQNREHRWLWASELIYVCLRNHCCECKPALRFEEVVFCLIHIKVWILAVCHVAVCEHKPSAKLWRRRRAINKVVIKSRLEFVKAVCHKVIHLHNARPHSTSWTTCYHIL